MRAAGVSHEDLSLLDAVAWTAVGNASVNSMLVVQAAASRVPLNQLVAHGDVTMLTPRLDICANWDEVELVSSRGV